MNEPTANAADESTPVRLGDGNELDALVAEHDVVLVDFYTKGCTLCQAVEPVVGNVARATDAVVAMVNPRDDLSLVEEYDIRSVPTLVLFVDGRPVGRLAEGFVDTETVVEFVTSRGRSKDGGESDGGPSNSGQSNGDQSDRDRPSES